MVRVRRRRRRRRCSRCSRRGSRVVVVLVKLMLLPPRHHGVEQADRGAAEQQRQRERTRDDRRVAEALLLAQVRVGTPREPGERVRRAERAAERRDWGLVEGQRRCRFVAFERKVLELEG